MRSKPIVVTGASGKTGSRIAALLEDQGHSVRRGSRQSATAFDWQQPLTWDALLEDAGAVYICYYPDFAFPGALDTLDAFTLAAKSAGVNQLAMISGRGESHALQAEDLILHSGIPATILRSAWFAENFSEGSLFEPVMQGVIPMPGDGVGEPIVDIDDFAEVAARVLTETGHEGQIYEITGPRVMTFAEVAQALSETLGHPIQYLPISFEQFHQELARATDRLYADIVTDIARETFDGRNAWVADGVERVLKRSARDFTRFAMKAAKAGAWTVAA